MAKPWISHYDSWVPHEIERDPQANVVDVFLDAGASFAENVAYSSFGAALSFTDVLSLSRDFAAYLQNDCGIRKGDRVAMMSPNIMAFPVGMFGVLRAGGVQGERQPDVHGARVGTPTE